MAKLELWQPNDTGWWLSQGFGGNEEMYKPFGIIGHNGIDLPLIDGEPIRASHDGVVLSADHDNSGGLGVVLVTDKEYDYKDTKCFFKTIYWHLKEGSIKVKVGQKVKIGDILGGADNTGFSTGTHLHYGLKPVYRGLDGWSWHDLEYNNGYKGAIDPIPFMLPYKAKDSLTVMIKLYEQVLALAKGLFSILQSK